MSAAVQPFIDTAISKTVNVPADYPFEDVQEPLSRGVAGRTQGHRHLSPEQRAGCGARSAGDRARRRRRRTSTRPIPDRRIRLDRAPQPPLASLRWPGRPELAERQPVLDVCGAASARRLRRLHRAYRRTASPYPFEVWINGAEQPRGLGAIAKTLSMDMRTDDRAWLDMKLVGAAEGQRRRRLRDGDAARRRARCACRASCRASPS